MTRAHVAAAGVPSTRSTSPPPEPSQPACPPSSVFPRRASAACRGRALRVSCGASEGLGARHGRRHGGSTERYGALVPRGGADLPRSRLLLALRAAGRAGRALAPPGARPGTDPGLLPHAVGGREVRVRRPPRADAGPGRDGPVARGRGGGLGLPRLRAPVGPVAPLAAALPLRLRGDLVARTPGVEGRRGELPPLARGAHPVLHGPQAAPARGGDRGHRQGSGTLPGVLPFLRPRVFTVSRRLRPQPARHRARMRHPRSLAVHPAGELQGTEDAAARLIHHASLTHGE
jgi:hypothetical protein